jgi:FkbM family methyltransferase
MPSIFKLIASIVTHPLNAPTWSTRIAGLSRMIRWQFVCRLLPGALVVLPFVNQSRLVVGRSDVGLTGNWYGGLDEPEEMGFLLHLLRAGDHFFDVGANAGSYTMVACSISGVSATAFEPIPATFQKLSMNIAINRYQSVAQARPTGVSSKKDRLVFTSDVDSMNHVLAPHEQIRSSSLEIDVDTLDSELASVSSESISIKIDVEGHEMAVLQGATELLGTGRVLAVLMETNSSAQRYGVSDEALFVFMKRHGYEPYSYDVVQRLLTAIGNHANRNLNTIFVKDRPAVEERLRTAPPFIVNGRSF